MFKFFKQKTKENAIIALDLGTENIKVVLFTVEEKYSKNGDLISKRGVIKSIARSAQKNIDTNLMTDMSSIINISKDLIKKVSDEAKLTPKQLVMGIAGEFIKGSTSTFKYKREDSNSKINISELRNIVHKLQWKAFEESRKDISLEMGFTEIDIKLVYSSVVDVKIDNYRVSNPLGFQGKELEMSIFNSFSPLAHYGAFNTIADELDLEFLGVISEQFALARCFEFENDDLSVIFIDIGGSITDIAVVNNGSVVSTKMFGVGGKTFTKRLAVELNISFDEAEVLKKSYSDDKMEVKSKKIISSILEEDINIWLDGVTLSLSEVKNLSSLPSKILLSGGGSYLPEIQNTLNTRKWYKKLAFANVPQATILQIKNLRNIIDENKVLKGAEDITPVSLVNMGINMTGGENITEKVLKKVIGIMKV